MARMMSGEGRGLSAGFSVAALATVIVIFLICLTVAYSFYISKERVRWEVEAKKTELSKRDAEVKATFKTKQRIQGFLDNHNTGQEVREFLAAQNLAQRDLPSEEVTFKQVLDALDVWIFRYEKARDQLQRRLASAKNVAKSNTDAAAVDEEAFRLLAEQKQKRHAELDKFLIDEVQRKESDVDKYNQERDAFAAEYSNLKDEHDKKKGDLLNSIATNEERTKVVRRELDFLSPGPVTRGPDAKVVASELERTSVKLERAVGEERKMYGSVTSRDIEEAYAAVGLAVDRKKIRLEEPIKELGLHEVQVRLHADVEATLRVEVIKKS